jgi:hypothetical protein
MDIIHNSKPEKTLVAIIGIDADGIYLPMAESNQCIYINEVGRASLHTHRFDALLIPGRIPVYAGDEITLKF